MWQSYGVSASANIAAFGPIIGLFAVGSNNTFGFGYSASITKAGFKKVENQTNQKYIYLWAGIATIVDENGKKEIFRYSYYRPASIRRASSP